MMEFPKLRSITKHGSDIVLNEDKVFYFVLIIFLLNTRVKFNLKKKSVLSKFK